jgi:hypothetical protein
MCWGDDKVMEEITVVAEQTSHEETSGRRAMRKFREMLIKRRDG